MLRIENAWEIVGPGAAAGAGTASGTSNSVSFSSIGSSGAFTSKRKKFAENQNILFVWPQSFY